MTDLKYLQFQPIDPASDADEISDTHKQQTQLNLDDPVDEDELEQFWTQVEQDIHEDPDWFTFADK